MRFISVTRRTNLKSTTRIRTRKDTLKQAKIIAIQDGWRYMNGAVAGEERINRSRADYALTSQQKSLDVRSRFKPPARFNEATLLGDGGAVD